MHVILTPLPWEDIHFAYLTLSAPMCSKLRLLKKKNSI